MIEPVKRCQEHMVADGEVERSVKADGMVTRTRRCGECGSLFKTTEIADDMMADIEAEHNVMVVELKKELGYYKEIVIEVRNIHKLERDLAEELMRESV